MKVLDTKTIVISDSNELKEILEEENLYTYIYFDSDITLTEGIIINEYKNKITIDGTYLNIKHTITGMDSDNIVDTISVSGTDGKFIFKNINIVTSNVYGIISVPSNIIYTNIITEFLNVKFNGTQFVYNPYGIVRIIDCNVTIENTNGNKAQEVCDANKIEIGGNTTIYSTAANSALFYFITSNPSVTFLPYSRVNLTTENLEFMRGTKNLDFSVLHDSEVNLTTGNGFATNTYHGANNVLIDERATFNFLETKHQRIPMWVINGTLTLNEGANLSIINTYDQTPTDNYNIHFKGTENKIILNNPNSFIIYSKNANVIYTNNPLEFSFKISRANFWTNSSDVLLAGSISNLPDYSFYKLDDLLEINGTLTKTETTINSSNLNEEDLNRLPDLSNFTFINRKQFSIGHSYINIYPIDNNTQSITGFTEPFSDVLIKYNNEEIIVTSESDGIFTYELTDSLNDNTNIEFISCKPTSYIYETKNITTPHMGELTLVDGTNNLPFSLIPVSINPTILPTSISTLLKIIDSRINSTNFKLYVKILEPLKSKNGKILNDAVIFKDFDDNIYILDDNPKLVYTGEENKGSPLVTDITWSNEKGILLSLKNNALEVNEEYNTKIIWDIEE